MAGEEEDMLRILWDKLLVLVVYRRKHTTAASPSIIRLYTN